MHKVVHTGSTYSIVVITLTDHLAHLLDTTESEIDRLSYQVTLYDVH